MRDSTGLLWALSQPSGTAIHRHTSPDGVTWTDRGALSLAVAFSAIVSCQIVTVSGIDSLIIVANVTGGWKTWVADITGTTLGSAQTATVTGKGAALAAFAQASNAIHVAAQSGATVSMWHCDAGDPTPINIPAPVSGSFSTVNNADVALGAPNLYLTMGDTLRNQITLVPIVLVGAGYIVGAPERAVSGVTGYHTAVFGSPDILYADAGGTQISVIKRTGTATYSTPAQVSASLNPANVTFAATYDPTSGKLYCAYDTAAAQSNGEVYLIARSGGYWVASTLMAGGDNAGYQSPRLGATVTGSAPDLVYLKGTSGTRELDYVSVPLSAPPNAPRNPTTGYVTTLAPTHSALYFDSAPNDGHQFSQNQVASDALGATIIEDTGQIAQTGNDWDYTGPALTYGTQVWWRRRDGDLLSASGAGVFGPWCAWTPITPVRGGTPVVVDTISAGQPASATTLYAPIFVLDYSWAHPDTDDGSAERAIVYEADGVAVNTDTGFVTLSPVIASGGTGTTNPIGSAVVNGRTYKIVIQIKDAVTGVVSTSAPITVTASFLPPNPPSNVNVQLFPDDGNILLTWDLDGTDSTISIDQSITERDLWIPRITGVTETSQILHPCPDNTYDYRITAYDAYGIASIPVIITDVTLPGQGDLNLCLWLNDTQTGDAVAIGVIDTESNLGIDQTEDERTFNPPGQPLPKTSYGTVLYEAGDLAVIIMPNVLSDGTVTDVDETVAALQALVGRHFTCLWREPTGISFYVKCSKFRREPTDAGLYRRVQLSIRKTLPPDVPFV